MIHIKFLMNAMKNISGDELKVLLIIDNTLSLNKTNYIELNRVVIAKVAGWWNEDRPKYSLNKVSKITGSLEEKGLLLKKNIYNKTTNERKTYYSIPTSEVEKDMQKKVEKNENFVQKSI